VAPNGQGVEDTPAPGGFVVLLAKSGSIVEKEKGKKINEKGNLCIANFGV
jgi:hypothetical protein